MRTIILKVLCCVCVAVMTNVSAFHNKHLYSNSKTKDYYKNYRHHSSVNPYKHPPRYSSNSLYNLNNNEVRLRHSRYPNLNSVMTRLDNIQSRTTTITTTSTTTPTPVTTVSPYHYIKNNRKDNLFLDSNSEGEEDIGSEADQDEWQDINNDDDPFEGEMNDADEDEDDFEEEKDGGDASWQAEEATTEAVAVSPYSRMDYKSRSRITSNQIEESNRKKSNPEYSSTKSEANAAILHAVRMNTETRCREPFPRVVSVQSEHPDPGKSYIPHCTVLHRCAEDTGCCPNHATICAPKIQVVVNLYFYTSTIGKHGNKIEKLPFINHTECACLEKPKETTTSENISPEVSRSYRSHLPAKVVSLQPMQLTAPALPRCKCPEEYTPILLKNSSCTCDCTDSNMDCGLIKRGNEFFSMKDRMCIQEKECGTPKCEYGPYITSIGRCPRRNEKLGVPTSVH